MNTTEENRTKEVQPDSSHEHKTKHTLYHFFGVLFIIVAVVPILFVMPKYYELHFNSFEERNNALQSILGVPVFFATVAGIFFVIDNLKLQRNTLLVQIEANKMQQQELKLQIDEQIESNKHFKEQNETIILQKNDSTFFNLIELHKKQYAELKNTLFFNTTSEKIQKSTSEYMTQYSADYFTSFYQTTLNPRFLCSPYNYNKDFRLEFYITNVKDIIYFISSKLNNDPFYHKTLYNVLLPEERFIIGMAQTLRLFDFYAEQVFNNDDEFAYDYARHYNSLSSYNFQKGYFPILNLESEKGLKSFQASSVKLIPFWLKIVLYENFLGKELSLKDVTVGYAVKPYLFEEVKKTFPVNQKVDSEVTFDYSVIVQEIVTKDIPESFQINFYFNFIYGNKNITIWHKEEIKVDSTKDVTFRPSNY